MAIILPGGGVADIRGSVAGNTFARNHYGNYVRSRTKPINPRSALQDAVRGYLAAVAVAWRETLTDVQRTGWKTYAAATSWLNALGQTIHLTGQNMYVRTNVLILQAGLTRIDAPPTTTGIPSQATLWTPSGTADDQKLSIAFTFPVNVANTHYLFFQGRQHSVGRTFYGGPWRYVGKISGATVSPPTSPVELDAAFPISVGGTDDMYCVYIDAQGRVSTPAQKSFSPASGA